MEIREFASVLWKKRKKREKYFFIRQQNIIFFLIINKLVIFVPIEENSFVSLKPKIYLYVTFYMYY